MRFARAVGHIDWRRRDIKDALVIFAIALATFAAAEQLALFDKVAVLAQEYESWHLDDFLIVVVVLGLALLLYGVRRRQDLTHEIEARRAAEEAATKRLFQLNTALDNMSQGLCLYDSAARIVLCNERYHQIWGLPPEVVKPGRTFADVLEYLRAIGKFHQDKEYYIGELRAQLAAGETFEKLIELGEGTAIHMLHRPVAGGGWVVTFEDVTAQRRAESDLDNTRNFLKTVIEHVPATILVKDARDFRYVLLNRTGAEFFGFPAEQIIGKTAHEFFPQAVADTMAARDRELLESGYQIYENDRPLHATDNSGRQVTTERLVIRGADGKPKYLLGVIVDITARKRAEAQIVHMAHHDALTGLANRVLFLEKVDEALARWRRRSEGFTVLMIDLDLFKAVNDSFGHPVGDALLKAVAQRLRACTRETDTVARLGGDEFAILQATEADQRECAVGLANRLLEIIGEPYELDGHQIIIGTSIGIVVAPHDATEANELLRCADLALYKAKSDGRNGYRFFESEMESEARSRHALQYQLREALARGEFELHYQTIFDGATRRICGAEALVRWYPPRGGVVASGEFVPLAEEIGLIVPLGEWIMRKACADALTWPAHIKLAVNLSPAQFRNRGLFNIVAQALADSGLLPGRLELEITETVLLERNAENLAILHQLKSLGISIVLDDFGTGYSSLSYLRAFPFDKIKIDRSFVSEISSRADCAAIVCAMTGLGRGLKILTTAEGVETEEQFELLRAAGVDQVQGFLFSRPCPLSELEFVQSDARPEAGRAA